jgi:hypothetical protein
MRTVKQRDGSLASFRGMKQENRPSVSLCFLLPGGVMDLLLKAVVTIMVMVLVIVQLLLISPYASRIYKDDLNGNPIQTRYSAINKGSVTLDALGEYKPNSAILFVNGEHVMSIDRFPIIINAEHCDVVEIFAEKGSPPFYVFLSDRSGNVETDMAESSVRIKPGINRVLAVTIRRQTPR